MKVLAVSDEVDEALLADPAAAREAVLVLACGDLPFAYLASLSGRLDLPLVFVPGNHDPDVGGYRTSRAGLTTRAGLPAEPPWPAGAVNADGRIVTVAGLTVAGLGGCVRYGDGPNQYTQRRYAARARALRTRHLLAGRPRVDVLLLHAPPTGAGDGPDPAHQGIDAAPALVAHLRPGLVLHGHVHPYGQRTVVGRVHGAPVHNVVGWHLLDTGEDRRAA